MGNLDQDLDILEQLFLNLPDSLPENPPKSKLSFELDPKMVAEEGWGVEFNHRMEVAWQSWRGAIVINERGERLSHCIALLRKAATTILGRERDMWVGGWIDKLIGAARLAGAMESVEEHLLIEVSDDSELESPSTTPSSALQAVHLPKSTANPQPLPNKKKFIQSKLTLTKVNQTTHQEQTTQNLSQINTALEAFEIADTIRQEQKVVDRKLKDKLRKQSERVRLVEEDIAAGRRDGDGHLLKAKKQSEISSDIDKDIKAAQAKIVDTNRSEKQKNRLLHQEKPSTAPLRICWQAPAYWIHILAAVKEEGGMENALKHPSDVVKRLKLTHQVSGLFEGLGKGVIRRWFDTNEDGQACWKDSILATVEKMSPTGGCGRSKKLSPYPLVVEGVIQQLNGLRRTNVPISCSIARSIVMAHVRMHATNLRDLSFSDRWLHSFLRSELGWSYRTATKAARKRPENWESQCALTFLRISRTVMRYNIKSPRLIVNADQTGVSLLPLGSKTWERCGSDQVNSICHEEKRQYTLVVASSCGGDILPFQSVWGGNTPASLPSDKSFRWKEAKDLGFMFAHGDTRHWSSLATTKQWVEEGLIPHFDRVCEEEGLPQQSPAILYLDCWPIHIAKSNDSCFIPWMTQNYPWITLIYCPAGCTGEFQPADTLLQRIVKHLIKTAALDFLAGWSTRLLKSGSKPAEVLLPRDLPTLRNASVAWTLEAYHYLLKRPEIVKKSWEKCQTGDWDLSWEKLTSPAATELFFSTVANNASFREEVVTHEPFLPLASPGTAPTTSEMDTVNDVGHADDLSIPADELFHALTGIRKSTITVDDDEALKRTGDEEDIEDVAKAAPIQPDLRESFPTDIAVLGGTHPAALEDLNAKKTTKAAGRKKSKAAGSEDQQQKVAKANAPTGAQANKRPRRSTIQYFQGEKVQETLRSTSDETDESGRSAEVVVHGRGTKRRARG